jgi:ankyrin repeat protein
MPSPLTVGHQSDLWDATRSNDYAAVEYLLRVGEVYVDDLNSLGETALHIAGKVTRSGL